MKIYLKGQEATDSYDKFDHELCGKEIHPGHVVSDGPRLVMVFSSGEQQGRGFKAEWVFFFMTLCKTFKNKLYFHVIFWNLYHVREVLLVGSIMWFEEKIVDGYFL